MPNLNLTHSGNMNITSAEITSAGTLNVQYEPNNTGGINRLTPVTPESGREDYESGETLNVRFIPTFYGTVLSETFVVSGVDEAGVNRSDSSVLRQGFDTDLRNYRISLFSHYLTINSSSVTPSFLEVNVTLQGDPNTGRFDLSTNYAGSLWVGYVQTEPTPEPTVASALTIVVSDSIVGSGFASAIYEPSNATVNLRYESNSPAYATIDPVTGEITVLQTGDVRFTVYDDISGLFNSKVVHCYEDGDEPITGDTGSVINYLAINAPAYILDSGTITAQYSPTYADVDLHYTSNLPAVASIDETTGEVTVYQTGNVTFCVSDTRSGLSDCISVNVGISGTGSTIYATSITINVPSTVTDTDFATATVMPAGAEVSLFYTYEDTDIIGANTASIDRYTGQINVRRTGTAIFCVQDLYSGLKDCKQVNVVKTPDPTVYISSLTLNVDDEVVGTGLAYVEFEPANATTNIVYSSSDTSIATIDNSGNITVLQDGNVTICATDTLTNISNCKTISVVALDSDCKVVILDWDYVTDGTKLKTYIECQQGGGEVGIYNCAYRSSDASIAEPIVFESAENDIVSVHQDGFVTFCADESTTETTDCFRTYAVKNGPAPSGNLVVGYNISEKNRTYTIASIGDSENNTDVSEAYLNGSLIPKEDWSVYRFQNTGVTEINYTLTRDILTSSNFNYNIYIQSVVVPEGVRGIIDGVFASCYSLKNVTLPSSCTIIGDNAFMFTSLRNIDLSKVEYIGKSAFAGRTSNSVGYTGNSLTSIYLSSCKKIGDSAFNQCTRLSSVLFNNNNVLTDIGNNAFQETNIRSITLPDSVVNIGDYVFHSSQNLTAVTIGNYIRTIGKNIFSNCPIERLEIKSTVPPTIGQNAFAGSYPIYVPCESVDAYKQAYPQYSSRIQCKGITRLVLIVNDSITNSGTASFYYEPSDAEGYDISFSSSNTDVATINPVNGYIVVNKTGNTTICVSDLVSGLESCKTISAIKTINSLELIVPDTINYYGKAYAQYTPEEGVSVNIVYSSSDENIATINSQTGDITAVDDGVVTITARDMVTGLSDSKTVNINAIGKQYVYADYNITTTGSTFLYSDLLGDANIVKTYCKNSGGRLEEITPIRDSYGYVNYSFQETGLKTLVFELADNSTSIGANFSYSDKIAPIVRLDLPSGITSIPNVERTPIATFTSIDVDTLPEATFARCSKLSSLDFNGKLKSIFADAFSGCTSLSTISLDGVTTLGNYAFRKSGLTSVTIPASVTSLGNNIFSGSTSLATAVVETSKVSQGMFASCNKLRTVTLSENVASIENGAFSSTGLKNLICNRTTAPSVAWGTAGGYTGYIGFIGVGSAGILTAPSGGSGYDAWMVSRTHYSLGYYGWTRA